MLAPPAEAPLAVSGPGEAATAGAIAAGDDARELPADGAQDGVNNSGEGTNQQSAAIVGGGVATPAPSPLPGGGGHDGYYDGRFGRHQGLDGQATNVHGQHGEGKRQRTESAAVTQQQAQQRQRADEATSNATFKSYYLPVIARSFEEAAAAARTAGDEATAAAWEEAAKATLIAAGRALGAHGGNDL